MRLLSLPAAHGGPPLWINPAHLVSVQALYRAGINGTVVEAEVKVEGMPLYRVALGEHFEKTAAYAAFDEFMRTLQADE